MPAILKTITATIVGGAVVVASFYLAYVLIFLGVLALIASIAYGLFNSAEVKKWFDYND